MGRRILVSNDNLEPVVAAEANYRLVEVADRKGVTARHMRRHIERTLHRRPHDLLAELRMNRILALLKERKSLKEIARIVGLNACYLSCLLKKFRRKRRGQNSK